jgi:hypothetical protein
LKVMPWEANSFHTAQWLTTVPRSASSAVSARKVRSGTASIRANNHACSPARTARLTPPIGLAAALPVARSRCDHLTTLATLTPKSLAVSRHVRPPATDAATRERKSSE